MITQTYFYMTDDLSTTFLIAIVFEEIRQTYFLV